MITIWMHKMFLGDSFKSESDFRYETESAVTLLYLLEKICEGDERLLFKLIDEQKNLRPHINIFIGDRNCRKINGIQSTVSARDEVSVFPSLSGG